MRSYVLLLAVVLFASSWTGVVYLTDRDKNNIMDSTFDENLYNNLLSKTIIFNNYTYYFKNGAPSFSSIYPEFKPILP